MLKKTKANATAGSGSIGDQIKSSAAAKGFNKLKKLAKLDESIAEERLHIWLFNDVIVHLKVSLCPRVLARFFFFFAIVAAIEMMLNTMLLLLLLVMLVMVMIHFHVCPGG